MSNRTKFWNEERDNKLRELWGANSCEKIAKILGRKSRSDVYTRARRIGLPKKGRQGIKWTSEMVQELRRLVGYGYGAPRIHHLLGGYPSVSAISSKIADLKIRETNTLQRYFQTRENEFYRRLSEREKPANDVVDASHKIPDRKLVDLLDLSTETCKFAFGEPGKPGFGFCGRPVKKGKSWCPDCYNVAVSGVVELKIECDEVEHTEA